MSELTKEMILDFFMKKGGVVKNVDLVRHFKKYLQVDDPHLKEVSRESFKEKVMDLANITMENGEKYLHLRPEYGQPASTLATKPPNGRQSIAVDGRPPVQQQQQQQQQQERRPHDTLPPPSSSSSADPTSRNARLSSYAAGYDRALLSKPTSLDEYTQQLDAYSSGRVDELPMRPLSTIGVVRSVGANMSSVAVPAAFYPVPKTSSTLLSFSGQNNNQDNNNGGLTAPMSIPGGGGGVPMDLLGVGTPNAHIRQPSDSGSIGSTGSGARPPPSSSSPQHSSFAYGYSLLSQNHADSGLPPRGRSNTTVSVTGLGHQPMRRMKSPQDIKSRPSSARRSRHIENHQPDQTGTISQPTPPLAKKRGPAVAPKPSSAERIAESSPAEADDDASDEEGSDYGIDPLDKEWMVYASRCDMDAIHRLVATEQTLINKKDFIFGYTALHWAAKQGRCDVMGALLMSGAQVNIQSNGGMTPLHLACQAGHDNAINILLEQNCNVNLREHTGKRALEMLHIKVSEKIRSMVLQRTKLYGAQPQLAPPNTLATFTRPRSNSALRRQWSSMEGLSNNTLHSKKVLSPRMAKRGLSFRKSKKPKGEAADK